MVGSCVSWISPCWAGVGGLEGLAKPGLGLGRERGLELALCVELALGSCWLLDRSNGPPRAMSVCCVYLGAGGFVMALQTGCPSAAAGCDGPYEKTALGL